MWTDVDFKVNKMFWRHWGADAALPLRLRNLADLFSAAAACNIDVVVVGRGARNLLDVNMLLEDHDDDLAFSCGLTDLFTKLEKHLIGLGFLTIRRNQIWSIVRYGRYIDLHPEFSGDTVRVDAYGMNFRVEHFPTSPSGKKLQNHRIHEFRSVFKKAVRSPRRTLISFLENLGPRDQPRGELLGEISLDQFLKLKFDSPTAINWEWRSEHTRPFAWPGATIEEILTTLDLEALRRSLVETPMDSPFSEPINLSKKFWSTGNNFFIAPMLAGFRYGVMPYTAANIYIASGLKPDLYSLAYYEALPRVSEDELPRFLKNHPIAVRGGSVRSGRHRVATMIGRLARGQEYIPFYGYSELAST
ncbi:MAG: hypothetical protein RIE23_05465 [Pontimonas sp.]